MVTIFEYYCVPKTKSKLPDLPGIFLSGTFGKLTGGVNLQVGLMVTETFLSLPETLIPDDFAHVLY
jgi:hypothetical protein